jgi:hypothetical protein
LAPVRPDPRWRTIGLCRNQNQLRVRASDSSGFQIPTACRENPGTSYRAHSSSGLEKAPLLTSVETRRKGRRTDLIIQALPEARKTMGGRVQTGNSSLKRGLDLDVRCICTWICKGAWLSYDTIVAMNHY